jgi:O-antigen/teichoic acid export membrane protein
MYDKILGRLRASDFLRSVSVLSSGSIIANIISICSLPVLSRIYSEEALGDYAVMISLAAILSCISALGLHSAIMTPKNDQEARELLTFIFSIQCVLLTFFFLVALTISPLYQCYTFSGNYGLSLFFIYSFTIVSALNSILSVYTNKLKKNRTLFLNSVINSLVLVTITIPLGVLGFGGYGFIIGAISSSLIADLHMIMVTHPFTLKKVISYNTLINKNRNFILYQFPSNVIGTFSLQMPRQVFSILFGNASLGNYAMCEKLLGIPSKLLGAPLGNVYFRHATIYAQEEKDLSAFTYKLISRILLLSFIPVVLLIYISEPMLCFILGENWSNVGFLVNIMIIPYVLSFCSTCLDYCLVVLEKQKINLYLTLLNLLLMITLISASYCYFKSFIGVVIGYALALLLYHLVNLVTIFYYLRNHFVKSTAIVLLYIIVVFIVCGKQFVM